MNTDSYVVRVNPAESTLGSMFPQAPALGAFRKTIYSGGVPVQKDDTGKWVRLLFGPVPRSARYGKVLAINRMLFGIFLCLYGFIFGSAPLMAFSPMAVFPIVAGVLLICGLFTRVVMFSLSAVFMVMAFNPDVNIVMGGAEIIAAGVSFMLAFIGPGRYSADSMIRRNVFRIVRKTRARRQEALRNSYKAYHAELM